MADIKNSASGEQGSVSQEVATISGKSDSPTSILGYSVRQVATLIILGLANFISALIISIQAPFYPAEAESKGATATEYGFVFGIFEFVCFIMSPIYGKYLHKLGPKTVFNIGLFTTAAATLGFGFLDRIDDHVTFISLSLLSRIVEALGAAAYITATFAITAAEFPTAIATTFASLETFFGLGQVVGPTVGGALFEAGGFVLPFIVMGILLLALGIVTFFLMPQPKEDANLGSNGYGVFAILRIPAVSLASFGIVAAAISIGFLAATLEPHVRQFGLSPIATGSIFIISGGLYAITAPIWGYICDRFVHPRYVALVGALCIFVSFLFVGPAPFIPVDTLLWVICCALVIHGIGLGATLVSSFNLILRESMDRGFGDNIHTYGICSGLWLSSFALGSFIGPSVGGYLLDVAGFRTGSIFILVIQVILTLLICNFIYRETNKSAAAGYKQGNISESAPLLTSVETDTAKSKPATAEPPTSGYGAL